MFGVKKSYIVGVLIMLVAVVKTCIVFFQTGEFNPMPHIEEFLGGAGLIFVRRGMTDETNQVKAAVENQ